MKYDLQLKVVEFNLQFMIFILNLVCFDFIGSKDDK